MDAKLYRKKIAQLAEASQAARYAAERKLKQQDALLEKTMINAAVAAADAAFEIQQANLKISAYEKAAEYFGKTIEHYTKKMASNDPVDVAIASYIRKGEPIPDEVEKKFIEIHCRENLINPTQFQYDQYKKTLVAGNNPQGGYFLRPRRAQEFITRIFETSPIRSIANITTTQFDELEFIIDDQEAASGGWVGETDPRGNTATPNVGLLKIAVHQQFAQPKVSQKMLDDPGFDIESWILAKSSEIITRTENTSFVVGDGAEKPKGFTQYPAWTNNGVYERFKLEQIESEDALGDISADDLKAVKNSLLEEYELRAVWGMNRATFAQVVTLKDGTGSYIFNTENLQDSTMTMNLLGAPVVLMSDMVAPDSVTSKFTTGDLPIVYGDFSAGYTILDKLGFRMLRDEVTDKPYVLYYTTKYTGGAVTNYQSLKLLRMQ